MMQAPDSLVIHLVRSEEDEECEACCRRVPLGVTYACCHQRCCLACYRHMHLGVSNTQCPFCRCAEMRVQMAYLTLRFYVASDEDSGTLLVSPYLTYADVCAMLRDRGHAQATPANTHLHHRGGPLVPARARLIETNAEDGDLLYIY